MRTTIVAKTLTVVESDPVGHVQVLPRRLRPRANADNASELFEDYSQSQETRVLRGTAVRAAAGTVVELTYAQLLSECVRRGSIPLVVFMSGGNGAGKSSSVAIDGPDHMGVFDSPLSQFDLSVAKITLQAGFDVDVRHVARDPEAAWRGLLDRAMQEGMGPR